MERRRAKRYKNFDPLGCKGVSKIYLEGLTWPYLETERNGIKILSL